MPGKCPRAMLVGCSTKPPCTASSSPLYPTSAKSISNLRKKRRLHWMPAALDVLSPHQKKRACSRHTSRSRQPIPARQCLQVITSPGTRSSPPGIRQAFETPPGALAPTSCHTPTASATSPTPGSAGRTPAQSGYRTPARTSVRTADANSSPFTGADRTSSIRLDREKNGF